MLEFQVSEGAKNALLLSTLAGLSTGIGGLLAILRKPDHKLLAALLGVAIGVMATLSLVELLLRNAYEHGWIAVPAASALGLSAYYILQPHLPDFDTSQKAVLIQGGQQLGEKDGARSPHAGSVHQARAEKSEGSAQGDKQHMTVAQRTRTADLLRLGLLMALTMTLHNLPEGFAVAFSSFTEFGPYMAAAIAMHNIPEGIIVAAPVFAATGSRWKALAIALASGLSEPLGAAIALVAVKPFVSEEPLHYVLAFVGGIMLAVCYLELWPEARKCKEDRRLFQGCAAGSIIMLATLAVGI